MSENFNSRYWIGKRAGHEELSRALRAAEQRERRNAQQRIRRRKQRIELLARTTYDRDMVLRGREGWTDWEELEPWQRESWRCEVDDDRDPARIRIVAEDPQRESDD